MKFPDECFSCHRVAKVYTVLDRGMKAPALYQYCYVCIELGRNSEDIRFATREARDLWLTKREL